MSFRRTFHWRLRSRTLELGPRTVVMGILNITPDSFSDGGKFLHRDHAVAHALQMLDEGADIIDIGGESTRPGVKVGDQGISVNEEIDRVLPVVEDILRERPQATRWDLAMPATLAATPCGVILMHTRGLPEVWRTQPPSPDIVAEVKRELGEVAESAIAAGVSRDRLVLDPGFGFGKRFDENIPLLAHFAEFSELGVPLLSGTSRKSFIGRTLARDGKDAIAEERLHGTLATVVISVMHGAHIVRVHDVKQAVEAVKVADAVLVTAGA